MASHITFSTTKGQGGLWNPASEIKDGSVMKGFRVQR